MPLFEYQGKQTDGAVVSGRVEAENEVAAARLVEERGLEVIGLNGVTPHVKILDRINSLLNRGASAKDLVVFFRQFAVMLSATVPIVQALKILIGQTTNKHFQEVILQIADDVDGGARLSQAFGSHPDLFNDFYVNMIKAGETSGKIDEVMNYLADQTEKDFAIRGKVRGAMMYPAFIVTGLIVVGFLMMVYVIPKITDVIEESGAELPLATRILIATSAFMQSYWWFIILLAVGVVAGVRFFIRTPRGRLVWDGLKIKLPMFGSLFRKIYLVRFTRSLATLIIGGVPMTQALEIVAQVVGNARFEELIISTSREVKDGRPLAQTLSDSPLLPVGVGQMIAVGEQTGKLDEVLNRITAFYSNEVDATIENLSTLIEPIIMVVMGIAVAGMVMAVILPMYNLAGST